MGVSRWIAQAEAHHADATALLDNLHGAEPDGPWARYCLAAAQVHAELATASSHAAVAVRPADDSVTHALDGISRVLASARAMRPDWRSDLGVFQHRQTLRQHLAVWATEKNLARRRRRAKRRS